MNVNQILSALESIADGVVADPGLRATTSAADINGGADAARLMNEVLATAIIRTGVNADGIITPAELEKVSDAIRADTALYTQFIEGHGDDEGNLETGFHLVQGDGGTLTFQGRAFIDTVADAIYHAGFEYYDGRFVNEDGNANEEVADVAGWLNWFLNGTNMVFGTSASETLYSGFYSSAFEDAANERFEAGAGNDDIWAGDGDDIVIAGTGHDRSGGGNGNDRLYGQAGNDKLWGDAGDDMLNGGFGDDELGGGEGNDMLIGRQGNDEMWGQNGNDVMYGEEGEDEMGGGVGNDRMFGGDDDDKVWGEAGDDRLDGGAGNDTIGGGDGNDLMAGGTGYDVITGGAGADRAFGGNGADTIWLGDGNDTGNGGNGNDEIGGGQGNDRILGGNGNDVIYGEAGDDTLLGQNDNDTIYAGDGNDTVNGGNGNDDLSGNGGADTVHGGWGDDAISGGDGVDTLIGGRGRDEIYGWDEDDARDTFVFNPGHSGTTAATRDQVYGFESGQDKIMLSGFSAISFAGSALAGSGTASFAFDGDYVLIDADGNGVADMEIELVYVNSVVASDFIVT